MKGRNRRRRKKKQSKLRLITVVLTGMIIIGAAIYGICFWRKGDVRTSPEELLVQYMNYIPKQEYEQMYAMLNVEASGNISQEDFIKRNSAIYKGIELQNMVIEILAYEEEQKIVTYRTSFDTVAGNISFENKAFFLEGEEEYKLVWNDSLIFLELSSTDKVRVSTVQAGRGEILDRNGRILAGMGIASSVGIVPGRLENRDEAIHQIAELLEINPEVIEKKLSAQWVKDDFFVPIQIIPKVKEIELLTFEPDEEVLKEQERQEKLLAIPGIMISDTEIREYPLGEAAYLVGYVQGVTAEEMESSLLHLGFHTELPFEIRMAESQYSNTEGIETEIQLADSGYGQGQVLVNPLHMACIYSAFCNEGNIIKPYLIYQKEVTVEYWIAGAFSVETADRVLEGTKKIVNDSHGTGYAAHRDDIVLAGKTGTAEIKASKSDTSGTELGWFVIYTPKETAERPILIISMAEDVKGRGGSAYVVNKDSLVLEEWFRGN